jgi:prepilin peptidase CpaA
MICELLWVGWIDLKSKKISNSWGLFHISLSFVLYLSQVIPYSFSWEIFILPLSVFLIGFILYLIEIMGAGDSKFLASFLLIIPLRFQLMFLEKLIFSTILTGGILLTFRLVKSWSHLKAFLVSRHWRGIREVITSRFSYAPVILLGWILFGLELWK